MWTFLARTQKLHNLNVPHKNSMAKAIFDSMKVNLNGVILIICLVGEDNLEHI